jgi:hypothetical protein
MLAQGRATTSRPWYSRGTGGIERRTSSVSRPPARRGRRTPRRGRTSPRAPARRVSRPRAAVHPRRPAAGGAAGWPWPA